MYEDNAWPETAPIETFIPERKRPQRVFVAGIAVLTGGAAAVLTGLAHLGAADPAATGILALPGGAALIWGGLVAVWSGILGYAVVKGRKWAPVPARWTGAGLVVWFTVHGLLLWSAKDDAVGGLAAVLAFVTAAAGVVVLAGTFGRDVTEYFRPTPQPSPFSTPTGQTPMGGNDADWIPPERRNAGPDTGFLS